MITLLLLVGLSEAAVSATAAAANPDAGRAAFASDVWSGVLNATDACQDAPSDTQPTPSPSPSAPTQRPIVRFRLQSGRSSQIDAHQTASALRADALALPNTLRVEVPASQTDAALASYTSRGDVLYAEPDRIETALETPNDPQFSAQ